MTKELETKYLKVLTTKEQREIIQRAIQAVMANEGVKEGRALELVCAEFLSSYYPQ